MKGERRNVCIYFRVNDYKLIRKIKERFGMEHFLINHIGPTIGAHTGTGTVALFFMGESR